MSNKKCALVIGHKSNSPGALNTTSGISEFIYNDELARMIQPLVTVPEVVLIYRNTHRGLPRKINNRNPDFIVSLNGNAFNGQVSSTEVLHYDGSEKGERIARILQGHLLQALGLRDRGTKPADVEDKGGPLLAYTWAPCIIGEPFFIDNDADFAVAQSHKAELATAYAQAIDEMAGMV